MQPGECPICGFPYLVHINEHAPWCTRVREEVDLHTVYVESGRRGAAKRWEAEEAEFTATLARLGLDANGYPLPKVDA